MKQRMFNPFFREDVGLKKLCLVIIVKEKEKEQFFIKSQILFFSVLRLIAKP